MSQLRLLASRGFFAAALAFCVSVILFSATDRIGGPRIDVSESPVDLGEHRQGTAVPLEFQVANSGRSELVIRTVKPTCGACIRVVSVPQEPIPPGRFDTIRAVLTTDSMSGPVRKTLVVHSNDPTRSKVVIEIQAIVCEKSSDLTRKE